MIWFVFALLANFLYSVSSIIDQVLRKRHVRHDGAFLIIMMCFFFVIWLFMLPFINVTIPPLPQLIAVLASGFIIMFMVFAYVYAISKEELSRVLPMLQFSSVLVLFFSIIFLGEVLHPLSYAGFALMLLAGFLLSVDRVGLSFSFNRTLLLVVCASVALAASSVALKFFYLSGSYWNGFFWFYLGGFSWTALFAFFSRNFGNVVARLKAFSPKIVFFFFLASAFGFLADLSYLYAVNHGPVSLVSIVGSTQIVILFLMTLFLSRYFPRILKEKTDRKTLLTKSIAITLMIVGLFLINRGV